MCCAMARMHAMVAFAACCWHPRTPTCNPLPMSHAQVLEAVEIVAPTKPVLSNVTAAPFPSDPLAIRELLGRQLVEPVRYAFLQASDAACLAPVLPACASGLCQSVPRHLHHQHALQVGGHPRQHAGSSAGRWWWWWWQLGGRDATV